MTSAHVFIATSLDGFIARENNSLDWLPQEQTEDEDTGYESFIKQVDGLIMGRSTFQTVQSFGFWPYKKPVIVLSRSLTQENLPEDLKQKVQIKNLSPKEALDFVHSQGWKRAYLDGGQLIQSFLNEGLVEDMIITTIPILIGKGKRLFGELTEDISLTLVQSQSFKSGLVQSQYRVLKK